IAHRIALAILEALESGCLTGANWVVEVDEPLGIAVESVSSALELLDAVGAVWGAASLAPDAVQLLTAESSWRLRRVSCSDYEAVDDDEAGDDLPDVRIRIEPFHGPFHRLPRQDDVP